MPCRIATYERRQRLIPIAIRLTTVATVTFSSPIVYSLFMEKQRHSVCGGRTVRQIVDAVQCFECNAVSLGYRMHRVADTYVVAANGRVAAAAFLAYIYICTGFQGEVFVHIVAVQHKLYVCPIERGGYLCHCGIFFEYVARPAIVSRLSQLI